MKSIPQLILEGLPFVLSLAEAARLLGTTKETARTELGAAVYVAEDEECVLRDDLALFWERNPWRTLDRSLEKSWPRAPTPITVKDLEGYHHFPSLNAARRVYGRGIDKVPKGKRRPRKFVGIEVFPGLVYGNWVQGQLPLGDPQFYRFDPALVGASIISGIRRFS